MVGVWGVNAINPDFNAIDGFIGGVQTISASNANIVLTAPAGSITPSGGPTQSQNAVLRFTGTLTANVQVMLPLPGFMIIENLTTGAFVLSFAAVSSGRVIAIQQGSCRHIYNDGTNVRFVNLPDVGSYLDIAAGAVPSWITACTVPPYLNCDGSTFSATTYPFLSAFLGKTTLPDFRGVSPAYLNQGTGRLTQVVNGNTIFSFGGTDTVTLAPSQIPTITSFGNNTISVRSANGNIAAVIGTNSSGGGSFGFNTVSNIGAVSSSDLNSISVTSNNTGSAQHSNTQPTTIGGIRLIRAV